MCRFPWLIMLALVVGPIGSPVQAGAKDTPHADAGAPPAIEWLRSEDAAFAKARAEGRFVLLDLEAVWCHWCHVMDEKTYADPAVILEVRAHYVALRVDQDARPDLAQRYGDYGWPATIVFAADGTEIVKKRGYIPAAGFAHLLRVIVADPSPVDYGDDPGELVAAVSDALDPDLRESLRKRQLATRDEKLGGLALAQKFLDHDSVEYELLAGINGDAKQTAHAHLTLDHALALLDPAWGGFYQYSTHRDWRHPHFEKLAALQGLYLRSYALAWASSGHDPAYADAVREVVRYIDGFLRGPGGAFFSSQDADLRPGEHSADYFALDDAARRALGIPRVDRHVYSSTNGAIIEGLAYWAEVAGDAHALGEAEVAARRIISLRTLADGGFRHAEQDAAGPFLADTLGLGRAFLALYRADADRRWLDRANAAASYIEAHFRRDAGGYVTVASRSSVASVPAIEENIALARWTNLLAYYTGNEAQAAMARHAMRWLGTRHAALHNATQPGILLLDRELARAPLHLTVVGAKQDAAARKLYAALQALPPWYKRIDWWDRAEGPLPNPDVRYPPVKRPAAFVCTDRRCSLPLHDVESLTAFLALEASESGRLPQP